MFSETKHPENKDKTLRVLIVGRIIFKGIKITKNVITGLILVKVSGANREILKG